jgi:hypothetical protein
MMFPKFLVRELPLPIKCTTSETHEGRFVVEAKTFTQNEFRENDPDVPDVNWKLGLVGYLLG